MNLLIRWLINAVSLYLVAQFYGGISLSGFGTALVAVVAIALVNALVKPILFLLTLPVTILTLGLFTFILNALMLWLASTLVPGFVVHGLGAALLGSILLSLVSAILTSLIK